MQAIITVNLTVMLVLTTMLASFLGLWRLVILFSFFRFISVSNSLPMTSYVKMIDIWLLFNLVIPFVEVSKKCFNFSESYIFVQVLLQTYIEYLRGKLDEKKEMNHHGKPVVVNTAVEIAPVE